MRRVFIITAALALLGGAVFAGSPPTVSVISSSEAIPSTGVVSNWGSNGMGELGIGNYQDQHAPVEVPNINGVVDIAGGSCNTAAVKNDGTVWVWGGYENEYSDNIYSYRRYRPAKMDGLANIMAVSSGMCFTLALGGDGTVWSWGRNEYSQLGTPSGDFRATPGRVMALTGVTKIAAGAYHSLALMNDGTVWAWGYNHEGQLGNGSWGNCDFWPQPVYGLTGVRDIAAGRSHSVALKSDGTVWTWGTNYSGELGIGEDLVTLQRSTPIQVPNLVGIKAVAAGCGRTYALRNNGTVCSWGDNTHGTLGIGINPILAPQQDSPVQVVGLSGVTAISAKEDHVMALKDNGTVWAWGNNYYGGIGNGDTWDQWSPVQVAGMSGACAISAGDEHSVALKGVSTVTFTALATGDPYPSFQWARNSTDIAGATNPTYTTSLAGAYSCTVSNIYGSAKSDSVSMEAGSAPAITTQPRSQHVCGSAVTLTVAASGVPTPSYQWYNSSGPITGATASSYATAIPEGYYCVATNTFGTATSDTAMLTDPRPNVSITPSNPTILSTGAVWAWGHNANRELGHDMTDSQPIPAKYPGLSGVAAIAANWDTSALMCDGTVVSSWYAPSAMGDIVAISGSDRLMKWGEVLDADYWERFYDAVAISSGIRHSLALKSDGTVWAWGFNEEGQLGIGAVGANQQWYEPVKLANLKGVTALAGGGVHSLALKNDGTVWAWGDNRCGQLGIGNTTDQYYPVQIPNFNTVIAIAGGQFHSLALKSDGTVWAWGYNLHGQIGTEDYTQYSPVQVSGVSDVIAIAAGADHNLALKRDGTVWAWGSNYYGQLGNGSYDWRNTTPVQVQGLSDVKAIAAGYDHSLALKDISTVTFTATVAGEPPFTYQWYRDGFSIYGATGLTYTTALAGRYSCEATNAYGSDYSMSTLTANTAPYIVTQPVSDIVCDTAVTFKVNARGTGDLTYQWYNADGPIAGAFYDEYYTGTSGSYYCVVTGEYGATTSNTATLITGSAPVLTYQSPSQKILYPGTYQFQVMAIAYPTYQWYNSEGPIPGATNRYYDANKTGNYYCVATNHCGSVTSDTMSLMVNYLVPDAKRLKDGEFFENDSLIVSAAFPDFFYVETDDRSMGIRVEKTAHGLTPGMRVHVTGIIATSSNQERYIAAKTAEIVEQVGTDSIIINPLGLPNRDIGGSDFAVGTVPITGQRGVYEWKSIRQTDGSLQHEWVKSTGLNNIGLLVTTWGTVTSVGSDYIYIDDGSALDDRTDNGIGIRVLCDPTGHSIGEHVVVTGISSCFANSNGDALRQIIMP